MARAAKSERRDREQRERAQEVELIEKLEQLRPLAAGMAMGVAVVKEPPRGGIDTEDDLARANSDWTALIPGRT